MSAGNGLSAGLQSRKAARFRVDALSYIDLGPSNGGMVTGVSETGLSFQGVQPLEDGEHLSVRFKLPQTKQFLSVVARIVWLNSSRKGGGLQFLEMTRESRSLLKDWLARRASPEVAQKAATNQVWDAEARLETSSAERPTAAASELLRAAVREGPAEAEDDVSSSASGLSETAFLPGRGGSPAHTGSPFRASLANSPANSPVLAAVRKFPRPLSEPEHEVPGATARETSKLLGWLLVCAASLAVLGAGSFLALGGRSTREVKVLSQSGDNSLGLKLERQGTEWQVSWNRNADSVLKAIGGHLSITDGQSRKDLDLEPSELRGGSILYTPMTNDVLVRLQLVGGSSDTPVSESVRILAGATALSPVAKPADRGLSRNTASTVASASSGSSSESARSAPTPRELIALDLTTPRRPAGIAALSTSSENGSKDFVASDTAESLSPSMPQATGFNLSSAPTPVRPVLGSGAPAGGGPSRVIPAQLILGKDPAFPPSAREMGISGSVTVHFRIEKDGRVSDATLVKGNPFFGRAAVEAVTARRYHPATVAGVAVESESDAVFVFNPK